MSPEQVAHHEAGHAVARWLFRECIHHATITADGDSLGHVAPVENCEPDVPRDRSLPLSGGWPWPLTPEQEYDLARWLNPIVAGSVAESLWAGRKTRLRGPDAKHAAKIAYRLGGGWKPTRAYLRRAWSETEAALRENWWLVARVAAELLEYKTISGDEVDRVCRGLVIVRPGAAFGLTNG